jgi:hypothetical protein
MNIKRPDPEETTVPDAWRLTRFFIPLAVQAASQSLCYPLVAMVASRGPGGPLDLAGLAQSNIVLFFLGISMISLVPTGMVYAQTREGYRRFYRLTMTIGGAMTAIQALLCIPALSHALFAQWIGLPPSIEAPARSTLLLSIPLQVIFFSRIPYFVVLYIGRATGVASIATIGRVVLTAALSPLFCLAGLVGPLWAVVALTIPVALEAFASGCFAQRFIRALPQSPGTPPGLREILWFNAPLTVGGYFLVLATITVAAFIARAADPERVLPAYYLSLGLVNPLAFAATRIQTVMLAFPPTATFQRRTLRFALAAGLVMGLLPLTFILPGIAELYYVQLQNLHPDDLILVRKTAAALVLFPLVVAIRAQSEGIAAWLKKPFAVLTGHAALLATIAGAGFTALGLAVPGYFIGAGCLTLGSLVSAATMRVMLRLTKAHDVRAPGAGH